MSVPEEISVSELKRMRDDGHSFVLLDVRDDDELAVARIDWAKHIPMPTVPERHEELVKDDDIVVMCHHGGRSERVAQFLRARGFSNVANLAGGVDAWAREIDPAVATY